MFAVSKFLVAIFAAQGISGTLGLSASAWKRTRSPPPAAASPPKQARVGQGSIEPVETRQGSIEPVESVEEESDHQPVDERLELNKK